MCEPTPVSAPLTFVGVNFRSATQFLFASTLSRALPIGKFMESHQKLIDSWLAGQAPPVGLT
jgi:hypothetical protein